MGTDEGDHKSLLARSATRRRFLGLAALAGAGFLGGCASGGGKSGDNPSDTISPRSEPEILPGLGAEPVAYAPPYPKVQPPPGANPVHIETMVWVIS